MRSLQLEDLVDCRPVKMIVAKTPVKDVISYKVGMGRTGCGSSQRIENQVGPLMHKGEATVSAVPSTDAVTLSPTIWDQRAHRQASCPLSLAVGQETPAKTSQPRSEIWSNEAQFLGLRLTA